MGWRFNIIIIIYISKFYNNSECVFFLKKISVIRNLILLAF